MQPNVTRTGKLALRQGLLFGLSLGTFFIICNVILSFAKLGTFLAGGIYSYTTTSTGNATLLGIDATTAPVVGEMLKVPSELLTELTAPLPLAASVIRPFASTVIFAEV